MTNPAELLRRVKRIAVVGCSASPGKDAHDVPLLMLQHGYDIIPVNPKAPEIFGVKAYKTLAEIPGPIDMVNVFRPSEETPDVARQAVAVGAKALWLQLGIANPEAKRIAEDAGLEYVENRCVKIELKR
jgi:predicted CoA-binding protein